MPEGASAPVYANDVCVIADIIDSAIYAANHEVVDT